MNLWVEMVVLKSAAIVEVDHFIQRREAAIVHVGRGAGHLAKCRCLESA
jgi:hypothetical protein